MIISRTVPGGEIWKTVSESALTKLHDSVTFLDKEIFGHHIKISYLWNFAVFPTHVL